MWPVTAAIQGVNPVLCFLNRYYCLLGETAKIFVFEADSHKEKTSKYQELAKKGLETTKQETNSYWRIEKCSRFDEEKNPLKG